MTITQDIITKLDIKSGDILIMRGHVPSEEVNQLCDLLNLAGIEGVTGIYIAEGATITPLKSLGEHNHEAYNRLQPHQQRVVVEKLELDDKLIKLRAFLKTELFAGLSLTDRHLLEAQESIMGNYSHILGQRIAAFGGNQ